MTSIAEREKWLAETSPGFQQILDDNEARRPLIVDAARKWQPLLQLLMDSGVADMIAERTHVEFPQLVIQDVAYEYAVPGFGFDREPIASVWPRKEEVNVFSANSHDMRGTALLNGGWSVGIIFDHQNPSLQVRASHVPDFRSTEPSMYDGHSHTVIFTLDQDRNFTITGATETFNGPIDHLNKRGLQRVNVGMNRAFKKPQISEEAISIGVL